MGRSERPALLRQQIFPFQSITLMFYMQLVFQIFIDKLRERGTAEAIDVIPGEVNDPF